MPVKFLFSLLLLVSVSVTWPQTLFAEGEVVPGNATAESTAGSSLQSSPETAVLQEVALNDWLSMTAQFNDRLLSTVFWSLSVVGGVFIGLLGFSWFSSSRNYERDRAALSQTIQAEIAKVSADLAVKNTDFQEKIYDELRSISEKLESDIAIKLENEILKIEENIKNLKSIIFNKIMYIELNSLDVESKQWESSSVYANSMACEIKIIEISLQSGLDWRIDSSVKRIDELISKSPISAHSWEPDLHGILEKLPSRFQSRKESIIEKLKLLS